MLLSGGCPDYEYPADGGNLCCKIKDHSEDLTKFLAYLGGNVAFGYGLVKYVAMFLLLGDDGVKRKMNASFYRGGRRNEEMHTNPLQTSV